MRGGARRCEEVRGDAKRCENVRGGARRCEAVLKVPPESQIAGARVFPINQARGLLCADGASRRHKEGERGAQPGDSSLGTAITRSTQAGHLHTITTTTQFRDTKVTVLDTHRRRWGPSLRRTHRCRRSPPAAMLRRISGPSGTTHGFTETTESSGGRGALSPDPESTDPWKIPGREQS